jgi:hypothetical protein
LDTSQFFDRRITPTMNPMNGGKDDTAHRHQHGVENADDNGAAVGRAFTVGDQRERQVKASGAFQETEAGGNVCLAQVGNRVVEDGPGKVGDHQHKG